MDYFAGLDVSLEKTHICILDRDGTVVFEASAASTPVSISALLQRATVCRHVVFETGRMALSGDRPGIQEPRPAEKLPTNCPS